MERKDSVALTGPENMELVRRCLALISAIAGRGACSENPEHVGYALQELTQVLFERTGSDERRFEPIPADQIHGLRWLIGELDFVNSGSEGMVASAHRCGLVWPWSHRLGYSVCQCEETRSRGSCN